MNKNVLNAGVTLIVVGIIMIGLFSYLFNIASHNYQVAQINQALGSTQYNPSNFRTLMTIWNMLMIIGIILVITGIPLAIVGAVTGTEVTYNKVNIFDRINKSTQNTELGNEPLKIIQTRYAKGEITAEQFEQMKKNLEH